MPRLFAGLLLVASATRAQNSVKNPGAPWPVWWTCRGRRRWVGRRGDCDGESCADGESGGNSAAAVVPHRGGRPLRSAFPRGGVEGQRRRHDDHRGRDGLLFSRWGSGQEQGRGEAWYAGFAYSYAFSGKYG